MLDSRQLLYRDDATPSLVSDLSAPPPLSAVHDVPDSWDDTTDDEEDEATATIDISPSSREERSSDEEAADEEAAAPGARLLYDELCELCGMQRFRLGAASDRGWW